MFVFFLQYGTFCYILSLLFHNPPTAPARYFGGYGSKTKQKERVRENSQPVKDRAGAQSI